jgi:hypothetical protein
LGLAYGDVIPDDKKLDLVYLGGMLRRKLFLGKTEVEHISRVISLKRSVQ